MDEDAVIKTQLEFYRTGGAGCQFVAHAANNPTKYEWRLSIAEVDAVQIADLIMTAVLHPKISTQSIVFPSTQGEGGFLELLKVLNASDLITLEQRAVFRDFICLGYRVRMGEIKSWMTGFGKFDFLPVTRQAPFAEITFRSKPRPPYKTVMKKAPAGVVHLADMDMKGMGKSEFMSRWQDSYTHTRSLLGHKPDLKSAAKTTFAIPLTLWERL